MPPRVWEAIEKALQNSQLDYRKVKAPALSFYALKTQESWFPWIKSIVNKEVQREAQDLLNNVLVPETQKNIEKFSNEMISGRVIELESTDHYCFIPRRDEVVSHMLEFLLTN